METSGSAGGMRPIQARGELGLGEGRRKRGGGIGDGVLLSQGQRHQ